MHLKLYLEDNDRLLEGIAFGFAARKEELMQKNMKLRIAYTPIINNFHNKSTLQLQIRDIQILKQS